MPSTSDKAVAAGAISFHIDRFVKGRLSKFTYGVPCCTRYNHSDPEHAKRQDKTYINLLGNLFVKDAFKTMLSKVRDCTSFNLPNLRTDAVETQGTKVLEDKEIRTTMHEIRESISGEDIVGRISRYDGSLSEPKWTDVEPSKISKLIPLSTSPHSRSERQVRDPVSCDRRHFCDTIHREIWDFGGYVLLS